MEFFWSVLAAAAAGVGTGLAGLSAATVMVPILIVLCPSFYGNTGAYRATAIALASDILGSAFTAAIYVRHKNIDLKRAAIMFACIVSMCIAGSIAAFRAGNVVLGSFSLLLCVGIGIRFLVRPDTKKDKVVPHGTRLDAKGIFISIFFGLTIGFGTGFVGTGGGMMMLVVFTAFLGMDRKSAVGTSTFIMTFTAVIAFVSHAMIEPEIVFSDWPILLTCVIAETTTSIVAARFANRVNDRTVGLATGFTLLGLGLAMIAIQYRDAIASCRLCMEVLSALGWFVLYIAGLAACALLIYETCRVPREIFRKILHFIAFTSIIFLLCVSKNWLADVLAAAVFCLAVYPILVAVEHKHAYQEILVERRPGEIKSSLLLLFGTDIVVVAAACGLLNAPWIAASAILMWGVGDTAAALIGKRFGRHRTGLRLADPNKTWEGSCAMFAAAAATGFVSMILFSPLNWPAAALYALIGGLFAAFSELISRNGNDTVIVPLVTEGALMLLSALHVGA